MARNALLKEPSVTSLNKLSTIEQETGANDEEIDLGDIFADFRFKSFRKHKLVEEDYSLLTLNDPDELT